MSIILRRLTTIALLLAVVAAPATAQKISDAHAAKAQQAIDKAVNYLRHSQGDDGSWTPKPGPAITGLVAAGMLRSPDISRDDPAMAKALNYILTRQKPDGGIYDAALKNYNTSICVMALSQVGDDPKAQAAIEKTYDFFRDLQWDTSKKDPRGNQVTRNHPYFGGAGYGDSKHGRPDGSNTFMMLSALYDSGFDCTSPMYLNAITYVNRLQGVPQNDMFADEIMQDGGFVYATSINKDHIGTPQTRTDDEFEKIKAGEKDEYDGPLPTYGSMTYAGYMSYLYAQLDRDDPRVRAARQWIRDHYTTETHPRMGEKSYYYYMHFLARALQANGEPIITDADGQKHNWAEDVIDSLVKRQRDDGSWSNQADRWMEGDPNLATAYCLVALQIAMGR